MNIESFPGFLEVSRPRDLLPKIGMQVRDNGCEAGRSSDGTFCFDVEYRIFNSVCIYIYTCFHMYT